MRIVIAGVGEVGMYLTEKLNRGNHDIVIIDPVKDKLTEINTYFDLMAVHGSSTSLTTLQQAEVDKADLFIAVTKAQEANIISAILAKKLGAKKTIARIDNNEYILDEHRKIIIELGIDALVYPEILASNEILNIINNPSILKSIEFADARLTVFSFRIYETMDIAYKSLIEISKKYSYFKARVVAISRDNYTIIPHGADVIKPGDIIFLVAESKDKDKIIEMLKYKKIEIKNVMILGGSRIGIKTAQALGDDFYVKLFEKDRNKSMMLADLLQKTLVIHAEARNADFLIDEGIERVDAFIAVTGNSEINILTSLLAKQLGVKLTIAEVENNDYLALARKMDIDHLINKKLIAASHIFAHTISANVISMQAFTDTKAEVLEFLVPKGAKITKKKLKDLDFPKGAIIGGGERNGETFIAVGDTIIQPGDKVIVFALPEVLDKVTRFFK